MNMGKKQRSEKIFFFLLTGFFMNDTKPFLWKPVFVWMLAKIG